MLDKILVDAAVRAGVELRERFSVDGYLVEDGAVVGVRGHEHNGAAVVERAHVVIGADGRNSELGPDRARQGVCGEAARTVVVLHLLPRPAGRGVRDLHPAQSRLGGVRDERRSHDGRPRLADAEAEAYRADPEGNFFKTLELVPEFAERVRAATRAERFTGAGLPGYLRKPYGPGWVLVGDAGYNKDPITAQGIIDAFRDADSVAGALHDVWSGRRTFDTAMSAHHAARDAQVMPIYEFTSQLAMLEPPPPEMQQLLGQIHGNQAAMDAFVSINAATMSPAEFFDPGFLGPLLAA